MLDINTTTQNITKNSFDTNHQQLSLDVSFEEYRNAFYRLINNDLKAAVYKHKNKLNKGRKNVFIRVSILNNMNRLEKFRNRLLYEVINGNLINTYKQDIKFINNFGTLYEYYWNNS